MLTAEETRLTMLAECKALIASATQSNTGPLMLTIKQIKYLVDEIESLAADNKTLDDELSCAQEEIHQWEDEFEQRVNALLSPDLENRRAQFERWYRDEFPGWQLHRHAEAYVTFPAQTAWKAWNAALGCPDAERACCVCGCTDERACPTGCSWVEANLCSACAAKSAEAPEGNSNRRLMLKPAPARPDLDALLEQARKHPMTPEEQRAQVVSFVYGSLSIDNPAITQEMVESAFNTVLREQLTSFVYGTYSLDKPASTRDMVDPAINKAAL